METQIDFKNIEQLSHYGSGLQDKLEAVSEVSSLKDCLRELEHLISEGEIALDQKRKELDRRLITATGADAVREITEQKSAVRMLEKRIEDLKYIQTLTLGTLPLRLKDLH